MGKKGARKPFFYWGNEGAWRAVFSREGRKGREVQGRLGELGVLSGLFSFREDCEVKGLANFWPSK